MPEWTSADFEDVRTRALTIAGHERGFCKIRHGDGVVGGCWCHGKGQNGSSLPCPPQPEPEKKVAPDPPDFHFSEMKVPWFPPRKE